ncbi:MAG: tetratricopeptide repeat protein [Planctomycetota bacterium]
MSQDSPNSAGQTDPKEIDTSADTGRIASDTHNEVTLGVSRDERTATATYDQPFEIAGFKIREELGRGGMGIVYLAEDLDLNRLVALKILPEGFATSPAARARFQREAAIASRFEHPNLCGVQRVGETDGKLWIAMRYIKGQPFEELLESSPTRSSGALSRLSHADSKLSRHLRILEKVARGLEVAHDAGVIHRDLKPGNIMIAEDGEPVLLDFGLAQDIDSRMAGAGLTQSGDLLGTPVYMAPEQIRGESHRADAGVDVWALGVMLYELAAGQRPFDGATRDALYHNILEQEPRSLRKVRPGVPRDLETIVETALSKDRNGRYASAGALADDLEALREIRPIRARPASLVEKTIKWSRRRPAAAALLLLACLTLPTVSWLYWSGKNKDASLYRVADGHLEDAESALYSRRPLLAARALAEFDRLRLDANGHESRVASLRERLETARLRQQVEVLVFDEDGDPKGQAALARLDELSRRPGAKLAATKLRALVLVRTGREEEAKQLLRARSPEQDPELVELRQGLFEDQTIVVKEELSAASLDEALAASVRGRHLDALVILESLMEQQPEAHWLAWFAAEQSTRLQDYHAALAHAGRARALLGEMSPLQKGRYSVHLRRAGHVQEALRQAMTAMVAAPNQLLLRLHLAGASSDAGNLDGAIRIYRDALKRNPEFAAAWRGLGTVYHDRGRFAEAEEAVRKSLEIEPEDPAALNNLASCLIEQEKNVEAVTVLEKSLQLRPDFPFALNSLSVARLRSGDLDGAMEVIDRTLELTPLYAQGHHNRGNILFSKGDLDSAFASYRRAFELSPEFIEPRLKMATVLLRQKRPEAAEKIYREVIERGEWNEALTNLSNILLGRGEMKEALGYAERAVKAVPGDVNCLRNLASAQMSNGLMAAAVETLAQALSHEPANEALIVGIAVLSAQTDALVAYALARRLEVLNSPLLAHAKALLGPLSVVIKETMPQRALSCALQGKAHFGAGRKAEAQEALEKAIALCSKTEAPTDHRQRYVVWIGEHEISELAQLLGAEERKKECAAALLRCQAPRRHSVVPGTEK